MPSKPDADLTSTLLARVRDIAFAAAIYLFFCGYIFRAEYYHRFGLPSSASMSDSALFFVYSYTVFKDSFWSLVEYVAVGLAIYVIVHVAIRKYWTERTAIISVSLAAMSLFPLLATMAVSAADFEADKYINWNPSDSTLTLGLRKDAQSSPSFQTHAGQVLFQSIDDHELHLFSLDGTTAYLVDRKYTPTGAKADLLVYALPRDEISHFELDLPPTPAPTATAALSKQNVGK